MGSDKLEEREALIRRAEAAFSQVLREAVIAGKYGRFGLVVSLQSGWIKTFERHHVETLK